MGQLLLLILLGLAGWFASTLWIIRRQVGRADYIRSYMFPPGLLERFAKRRPGLDLADRHLAAHALRQFFLVYLKSGFRPVSMPSQSVDDLWHEFILYTKNYEQFCKMAFGRFLHHAPAEVLSTEQRANDGLRRTWWYACLEENINPRNATRLPLLFALDGKLKLEDGFRYAPDCAELRKNGDGDVYCGGDFSSPGASEHGYSFSHETHFDGPSGDHGHGHGHGHGDGGGGHGHGSDGGHADSGGHSGCHGGCSSCSGGGD
jgi:hypothetical protein